MNGPTRRCMPLSEWPEEDRAAWEAALQGGSILDDRGPAAHWRSATRKAGLQGYGHWLQYLRDHGLLPDPRSGLTELSRTGILEFTLFLEERVAPATVVIQLHHLYLAVRVMAPKTDWKWLRRFCTHVRNRNRYAPRRPRRYVDSGRLLELGLSLMDGAEQDTKSRDLPRAVQYRDGLVIALLATRPLRRRTLAAIRTGWQLRRTNDDWWLVFAPEDVKNRRPLEFPVTDVLIPRFKRYLDHWRSKFSRAAENDHLWQSIQGPMTAGALYQRVEKRTREALGFPVPIHQFRHAAATTTSRHDPEHVLSIASLLGHATPDTAYKHYVVAGGIEASRTYQAVLRSLQYGSAKPRPSR